MSEYLILGLNDDDIRYILDKVNSKGLMPMEISYVEINLDLLTDESIHYLDAQSFASVKTVFIKRCKVPNSKITEFIIRYFLYLSDKICYV